MEEIYYALKMITHLGKTRMRFLKSFLGRNKRFFRLHPRFTQIDFIRVLPQMGKTRMRLLNNVL